MTGSRPLTKAPQNSSYRSSATSGYVISPIVYLSQCLSTWIPLDNISESAGVDSQLGLNRLFPYNVKVTENAAVETARKEGSWGLAELSAD